MTHEDVIKAAVEKASPKDLEKKARALRVLVLCSEKGLDVSIEEAEVALQEVNPQFFVPKAVAKLLKEKAPAVGESA